MDSSPAKQGDPKPPSRVASLVTGLVLLLVLAQCLVGFLATFEPLERSSQLVWRGAYAVGGTLALIGLVLLARSRRRRTTGSGS